MSEGPGGRPPALGFGVIGANPEGSWAARAHLPAIAALPSAALRAVCTSRSASARAAAVAFAAPFWTTDPEELVSRPDVDVVVVSVKVPAHRALVSTALRARKHVYCEWPLGTDLAEAQALAEEARRAGVRTAIGLQARANPVVQRARRALASGMLGEMTSGFGVSTSGRGSDPIPPEAEFLYDRRSGANTLTITAGHLIDLSSFLVGEPAWVCGAVETTRSELVTESGARLVATAPDTVAYVAGTRSGAVLSLHVSQGRVGATGTRLEIAGTEGVLMLTARDRLAVQISRLRGEVVMRRGVEDLDTDEDSEAGWQIPISARNVYRALAAFIGDIRRGTHVLPDFDEAVRRQALLARLETAAAAGERQRLAS